MTTPTTTSARLSTDAGFPRRAAAILLFALLIVALVGRTTFLIWEPPFDGTIHYDAIAPLGATYWLMHVYVAGPAFTITWVATAMFIALLARGRSAAASIVAALMTGLGGVVFALVITAEGLPFAYAADPTIFSEDEGRALFDVLNANLGLLLPTIVGSQAIVAIGVLIFLVVAVVTRVVPRWFSIAGLVYLVAYVALPFDQLGRVPLVISDLVQVLLVAGIGWFGMRSILRRPA